ncbi:MAG: GNAT family N-acetyltransferase [Candidatus Coproplasma sp.]
MNCVGEMVGKTFADDGALRYLLGDISEKVRSRYCKTTYQAMLGDAIMISSDSDIDNLIVLCPPGYRGIPTMRFLLNGGISTLCGVGLSAIKRSVAFEKNAVEVRKRFSDDRTWYLMTFAVREGKKGQRLGSKILRPVLEWMDNNRYSVYLETHKKVNVEIYEHFGFKTVDTCTIPGSEIKQYGLLRPSR